MEVRKLIRAFISVYDKRDLSDFAGGLANLGIDIISSGGTAGELAKSGISATEVSELTGVGEALDGRLKTIHPVIYAGVLARLDDPSHLADLKELGAEPISLVVCNLYPFESDPSVELIDVGGPAIVRAAAKNHEYVGVVIDPDDYEQVLLEMREQLNGEKQDKPVLSLETRTRLAEKAFRHTAKYDAAITQWLKEGGQKKKSGKKTTKETEAGTDSQPGETKKSSGTSPLQEKLTLNLTKTRDLRYGENPHQAGALYEVAEIEELAGAEHREEYKEEQKESRSFLDGMEQLNGKELSYLNIYDLTAGWMLAHELPLQIPPQTGSPAQDELAKPSASAVIIKHANPCGAALAPDIETAFSNALACDPVSAFGGIVALNQPISQKLAEKMRDLFLEVLIAPDFEGSALELLKKRQNLRILKASPPSAPGLHIRSAGGSILVQTPDNPGEHKEGEWKIMTSKKPTDSQWYDLVFAEKVAAAVSSNAIVIAKDLTAFGIGAGQQNRKDSAGIAARKADGRARGGVMASDGFLPFADALDGAIEAGCEAVVQPGGSVKDEEVTAAAEAAGLSMVFSGRRRFRH